MSLDACQHEVLQNILAKLLHHHGTYYVSGSRGLSFMPWRPHGHFGHCGQNCLCCRAHNFEDSIASAAFQCEECLEAWTLTTVSRRMRDATKDYARLTYGCKCGGACPQTWFQRGWVCPVDWYYPPWRHVRSGIFDTPEDRRREGESTTGPGRVTRAPIGFYNTHPENVAHRRYVLPERHVTMIRGRPWVLNLS